MGQLSSAILAMQTDSVFAAEYAKGASKAKYWEHTYEDLLNVLARLPEVCALIYQCTYFDGKVAPYDKSLDYSGNFCQMLGLTDPGFMELMRLYIVIHSDHEGGNASAHTCHLVGSTLSDPYLSLSASMNALAGPLHCLANQEGLALHVAARVCAQALPRGRAPQGGQHRLPSDAGRAHRAREDKEPVPERRLALRRAAHALRLRQVRLLHGAIWPRARVWRPRAAVLGP